MKKTLAVTFVLLMIFSATPVTVFAAAPAARIIETVYPTDDVVIADIVATEPPYNADRTGASDSTAAIQKAIDDCFENGGGTVFLPVGKYLVSGTIDIKPFVTLRGDWQDPDTGKEYGTIIVADVQSIDDIEPSLFIVGGSAGAMGLTVFYKNQSLDDIKPYPYTFYINGNGSSYMLQSIVNCTLLNSYRGIGVCAQYENGISQCHEQLTLENIKATCLSRGLTVYNQADVGTVKTFVLSNKYWSEAGESFNAPERDALDSYTRANAVAFTFGDLEWPEFTNIRISDFEYGIKFVKGPRYAFSGTFYDIEIRNCDYGIYAPKGIVCVREKQWGIAFAKGFIEGSKYAIYDVGDSVGVYTDIETSGKVKGKNLIISDGDFSQTEIDYSTTYQKPRSVLYTVEADKTGQSDISQALQSKLDEAAVTSGVVYLPAGCYRLSAPVTVPANVELRGASSVAVRDQSGCSAGTLVLSYYGYDDAKAKPLITLAGENAGLNGVRVMYPLNNPNPNGINGEYKTTSAAVRGECSGVYVVNCMIALPSVCVEMDGSDGFFIKKLTGCGIDSMFKISDCNGGMIEGCLQNATSVTRNNFKHLGIAEVSDWITEDKIFTHIFEPILRKTCTYLSVSNSQELTVLSSFIYGGASFMHSKDSTATLCNVGSDGSGKNLSMLELEGGKVTVINAMMSTFDGKDTVRSYSNSGTKLKVFNRLTVDIHYNQYNVIENYSLNELDKADIRTFFLQPIYKIITFFGNIITKIEQRS